MHIYILRRWRYCCTQLVRAVCHQALHRCQILATELLMEVKNASVVEAWDDFVQCRIMASRDFSKDKAIRFALLTYILRSDILCAHMVDCIREGMVVYRHAEASSYLEMYEYVKNLILVIHLVSGMPTRGTEQSTYKIQHGRSSRGSLFLLEKNQADYCKTRSIMQTNKEHCLISTAYGCFGVETICVLFGIIFR